MDLLSPQIVERMAADLRRRSLVPVTNMGRVLAAEYQARFKAALAEVLVDDPEFQKAPKQAEIAAHRRLLAEGGNMCSPARAREMFQLPLTETMPQWTPSAEFPSPPAIQPRHEIQFAERRLAAGELPFYMFSADEWLDLQTCGGQVGTNNDAGLREWQPEFYAKLIERIEAQRAATAQAEQIAGKATGKKAA